VPPPGPDAPPSTVPRYLAGAYEVESELDLPLPPAATVALMPITAAIDDADDPSRYVLDRMVDELPDGTVKTIARDAVPLLASYLNARLTDVAPRLVSGLHALVLGLDRIERHVGTIESWQIDAQGEMTRVFHAARFEVGSTPVEVEFAAQGQDDRVAMTHVTVEPTGRLAIAPHRMPLGYGALIRVGLDRAVIPGVDPGANDLPTVFADLIDCQRLGQMIADELGIGTVGVYRAACATAMIAIADEVYTRLAAIDGAAPLVLELAGTAQGSDADHDGSLDDVHAGTWTGTLDAVGPIGAASFVGARVR
jgi:hypothetical protein